MGGPVFNQPVEGVDDGVKKFAMRGLSEKGGYGVIGHSDSYIGVYGETDSGVGMWGSSYKGSAVIGTSDSGPGVIGSSNSHFGVRGGSLNYTGVSGASDSGTGVDGISRSGDGVVGESLGIKTYGVRGRCDNGYGMWGSSRIGIGVIGSSSSYIGVYAYSYSGYAAFLNGDVSITGNLQKGGGSFKIDHPLDPANKYLSHSFVESPDMKNVYDGVVLLGDKGEAVIYLPDWFGALNKDFRYQLTAIGAPGPNLHIAEEIICDVTAKYGSEDNNNPSHFRIAGGIPGMKVSWQITGIRKDPWANANRIEVEQDKSNNERGYYLHPDLHGQPEEKGISSLLFPMDKQEQEQQLIINKKMKKNKP